MIDNKVLNPLSLKTDPGRRSPNETSFVLNGVLSRDKATKLQCEGGNELSYILPTGYVHCGHINVDRYITVIFSVSDTSSEIGLQENNTYTTLVNYEGLGFSTQYPVRGLFSIKNKCDRVVYYNDYNNPDRFLNIDRLDEFKTDGEWDLNKMKIDRDYLIPYVNDISIANTGGLLDVGSYAFAFEILDSAANRVFVSDFSPNIPIYSDNLNNTFFNINGSFNINNRVTIDGGSAPTTKSINLFISNLDTRFKYYRVIIGRMISGDGITVEYFRDNNLKPIHENQYIFRGITNGFEQVTRDSILYIANKYPTSFKLEQVGKNLTRSNLKTKERNYAEIQQLANDITVNWISKQALSFSTNDRGNAKNPIMWFDSRTFMGDEIYGLGISFLWPEGDESSIGHIPGREASSQDLFELTVAQSPSGGGQIAYSEVRHTGVNINETIPRWKAVNTADLSGRLGYYETDNSYPSVTDCDGNRVYPTGNVRHHRMPCRRLLPISEVAGIPYATGTTFLNLIGLEFDNIVYPEGAIAHRFHVVKRTEFDKTVLDTGWMFGRVDEGLTNTELDFDYYNFRDYDVRWQTNNPIVGFISPKILAGNFPIGTHFKLLSSTEKSSQVNVNTAYELYNSNKELLVKTFVESFLTTSIPTATYRTFDTNFYMEPNSEQNIIGNLLKPVRNVSYSNSIGVFNLLDLPGENEKNIICSLKREVVPYNNFESLEYIPISKYLTLDDSQEIYGGDCFLSHFAMVNIYDISAEEFSIFDSEFDIDIEVFADYYNRLWVETDLNYDLRVEGLEYNRLYIENTNLNEYVLSRVADQQEDDEFKLKYPEREYYAYNQDFHIYHFGRSSFTLPITYDYCSKCHTLENDIIWSEKSLIEELYDGWLTYRLENKITVGEHTGMITGVHFEKNRLWVRTKRSRFQLTPNPQVLQSDEAAVYIGTADFLSLPESELVKTSYGYAGGQGFLDEINTEFGLISVDCQHGQIHLLSQEGIVVLSDEEFGNYEFFSKYLNSSDNLRAVQLSYDPFLKRLIVNHRLNNWVLSFDLKKRVWVSFHSYPTQYIYNDGVNLFSTNSNRALRHIVNYNFCTFDSTKYDFVVEQQLFNPRTSNLQVIEYYAQTFDNTLQVEYPTFDRVWVYSHKQSTGLITLKEQHPQYKDYLPWSNTEAVVTNTEKNYRVNRFRDISTGSEVYNGRVDLLTPINVNVNTPQYHLMYLNDKLFNVRFYYKPNTDSLIIVDIVETSNLLTIL